MFKRIKYMGICSALLLINTSSAYADIDHNTTSLASSHAPIGVMGDHLHKQGEWMFSYRYSHMDMEDNRNGSHNVTTNQVLADFMVAPLDMRMEMHMFGGMYGISDTLSVMAMMPYIEKSMHHINRMNVRFNTQSKGIGDTKLSGLYSLYDDKADYGSHHKLHLNIGISLPTGSISKRDATPAGPNQKLPYPMQLGSGTFDPLIGMTYNYYRDDWSFGAQIGSVLRVGENSEGYRLGNEYTATSWLAKSFNEKASLSLRLEGKSWGNIHGQDTDLNIGMVPTARTDLRGGERLDALIGINLYQTEGTLEGHRLALEFGMPLYQRLDGPQLQTDYRFMFGWQKAF